MTRRQLLRTGGAVGAGFALSVMVPRFARASTFAALGFPVPGDGPLPIRDDSRVKALALKALDAARSAGAAYADVRLARRDTRSANFNKSNSFESWHIGASGTLTIGVRALVGGYWGYASSGIWTEEEAVRLGTEAVRQAKVATAGKARVVDLAPLQERAQGHWETPVEIDPTTVSWTEMADFTRGIGTAFNRSALFSVVKYERAFASTDNAYATQTTFRAASTDPYFSAPGSKIPSLTTAAAGWEYIRNHRFFDQAAEAGAWWGTLRRPVSSVPVTGRFPVVMGAELAAYIASSTLGRATELDRMMGYRANAEGTSYLTDPLDMVGAYAVASPKVTVTADRTMPKGCATVKWDDEGVSTDEYRLVEKGRLSDCATTRESASWLAAYYRKSNMPLVSHAAAESRDNDPPETTTPNLTIAPSATPASLQDLCAELPGTGYLMVAGTPATNIDYQQLNGLTNCSLVEVRNGKLHASAVGGTFMFRAPEIWNNVLACGDASTAVTVGVEYGQDRMGWVSTKSPFAHSVSAVPLRLKEIMFIQPLGIRL